MKRVSISCQWSQSLKTWSYIYPTYHRLLFSQPDTRQGQIRLSMARHRFKVKPGGQFPCCASLNEKEKYENKFGEKNMCQSIFVFVLFSSFNRIGLKMCRHRIIVTMHRSANLIYLQRMGPMARYIWEFGVAAHCFTDTPSTEKLTLNLAQVDRPDEVNDPVCPITSQSRVKHYIGSGGIAKPTQQLSYL